MFEKDEAIQKAIENVYELTIPLNRGDVLRHESIMAVIRLRPHEEYWQHVVDTVRGRLEERRGISTWPANNIGYALCSEDEQIDIGRRRTRKAYRQIRRARRSVEALPAAGLSVNRQRRRALTAAHLKETQSTLRKSIKEQKLICASRDKLPRRPVSENGCVLQMDIAS